jgi:hypothetical protein
MVDKNEYNLAIEVSAVMNWSYHKDDIMKVFISWSGERSKVVAQKLRDWIPTILQRTNPWMSDVDIAAGVRWNQEISGELAASQFGIICLTKENQDKPWIMFEAGALAKTLQDTFVCPYLIRMTKADLLQGPLTQFQVKLADKDETWELVRTINIALKENSVGEPQLKRLFDLTWPELEKVVADLPAEPGASSPERPIRDMVEEVLEVVRGLQRPSAQDISSYIPTKPPTTVSVRRTQDGTVIYESQDERTEFTPGDLVVFLMDRGYRKKTIDTILRQLDEIKLGQQYYFGG